MDIYIDFVDKMIQKSQVKKYPLTAERRSLLGLEVFSQQRLMPRKRVFRTSHPLFTDGCQTPMYYSIVSRHTIETF